MSPREAADRLSVLMAEAEDMRCLLVEHLRRKDDVPLSDSAARHIGTALHKLRDLAEVRYVGVYAEGAVDELECAEREAQQEAAP